MAETFALEPIFENHPQGTEKSVMSTVGTTNYYLMEHAIYDAAGRSDRLYLGAASQGANPLLVNNYDYYGWTTMGGRLRYLQSGLFGNQTSLESLEYTYDAAGNIAWIKDYWAGSPQTQNFGYDNLDRLTSASATNGTVGNYLQSYGYSSVGNLDNKTGNGTYTYGDAAHKHAVTATGNGWSFGYDANGNMTSRNVGGSYTLSYDPENRLVSVSGAATASFVFDGDGNRVQGTVAGVTTVYIGKAFEYSAGVGKKYFSAAGTMIAMRSGSNGLQWLAGDHLGSTSVSSDSSGQNPLRQTYYPWGENRYPVTSSLPTTIRYTGQRAEPGLGGIYFYQARWYDPVLARFLSPDTIIPKGQGVQAWDRYAGMNNNPVRFNDPSGHCIICSVVDVLGSLLNPNPATVQALTVVAGWATGVGPEFQEFGPSQPLTQEVMQEKQVTQFQEQWKASGYEVPFSAITTVDNRDGSISGMIESGLGFAKAQIDLGLSLLGWGSDDPIGEIDAVEGTLGSFDTITAQDAGMDSSGNSTVKIVASNSTGRASFTRIPGTDFTILQNIPWGQGWGGTTYQEYYWYETMPEENK